jgi:hypothetical protein
MSIRVTIGATVVTVAAALAGFTEPALGAEVNAGPPAGSVVRGAGAMDRAEQVRVEQYWTVERMANAVSAADPATGRRSESNQESAKAGGAIAVQVPAHRFVGKVFFTMSGVDQVCSGAVTESINLSVVTTAGHCVSQGAGAFATNFAFVPEYQDGARPWGTWTAKSLYTTVGWKNSGDLNVNVGFAVMNRNASQNELMAAVDGGLGIEFNRPRGQEYDVYGYADVLPYNGEKLWQCAGTAVDAKHGSTSIGIPCPMSGGADGGPWLTRGWQKLNSVSSHRLSGDERQYGPYFGDAVKAVFDQAQWESV